MLPNNYQDGQQPATPSHVPLPTLSFVAWPNGVTIEHYSIERELGSDGITISYLAADISIGQRCLMRRFFPPAGTASPEQIARFQQSVERLISLNFPGHPGVPPVFNYLPAHACLVMKYVEGRSLAEIRTKRHIIPELEALHLIRAACDTLVYLHSRPNPVAHGRLGLKQILIDNVGRAWLIGLSLADRPGEPADDVVALANGLQDLLEDRNSPPLRESLAPDVTETLRRGLAGELSASDLRDELDKLIVARSRRPELQLPDSTPIPSPAALTAWCIENWQEAINWGYDSLLEQVAAAWGEADFPLGRLRMLRTLSKSNPDAFLDIVLQILDPEDYGARIPNLVLPDQRKELARLGVEQMQYLWIDVQNTNPTCFVQVRLILPPEVTVASYNESTFALRPGDRRSISLHARVTKQAIPGQSLGRIIVVGERLDWLSTGLMVNQRTHAAIELLVGTKSGLQLRVIELRKKFLELLGYGIATVVIVIPILVILLTGAFLFIYFRSRPELLIPVGILLAVVAVPFFLIRQRNMRRKAAQRDEAEMETLYKQLRDEIDDRKWGKAARNARAIQRINPVYRDLAQLIETLPHLRHALDLWGRRAWLSEKPYLLQQLRGHVRSVRSVCFSPDGQVLASASADGTVRLWSITDGQPITTLVGHRGAVTAVCFTSDGATLLSASTDGTVRIWSIAERSLLNALHWPGQPISSMAIHPDGKKIALGGNGPITIWDINATAPILEITGHIGKISSLAFSADGCLLASGSYDTTGRVWDISHGSCVTEIGHNYQRVHALALCPDGNLLLTGGDGSRTRRWILGTTIGGKALMPESQYKSIIRWLRRLYALSTEQYDSIRSLAFSSDGKVFAEGHYKGKIEICRASNSQTISYLTTRRLVECLAFSPDGQMLAAGVGSQIQLWRAV